MTRPTIWLAIMALLTVVFFAAALTQGRAHSWYSSTKDPETGLGCCGGYDCDKVDESQLKKTSDGYIYLPSGEFIPQSRVQQSRDFDFHRCVYLYDDTYGNRFKKGETRCFFEPTPGM